MIREKTSSHVVPREDVLVTACFGHLPVDAAGFQAVRALAHELDRHFRFREIIIVAEESHKDAYLPLLQSVDNLRLITVHNGTTFYRRRVVAADEAIGDVVLLANAAELPHLDAIDMIERAGREQCAIIASRSARVSDRTLGTPLVALGRAAGFKVALRDLQTLAVARTVLNQLLGHPDPDLALRFLPRKEHVSLGFAKVANDVPELREAGQMHRRIVLLQKLLVYIAPSLLMAVTLSSGLLAMMGLFYAVYVIGAWLIVESLEPGWLTLSMVLSLIAFFLGLSIMGLSLGLQQLLARADRDEIDSVVSEVNRIDLFGQVASDLNIDLERDATDAQPASVKEEPRS